MTITIVCFEPILFIVKQCNKRIFLNNILVIRHFDEELEEMFY